jgi:hypothetical protein
MEKEYIQEQIQKMKETAWWGIFQKFIESEKNRLSENFMKDMWIYKYENKYNALHLMQLQWNMLDYIKWLDQEIITNNLPWYEKFIQQAD